MGNSKSKRDLWGIQKASVLEVQNQNFIFSDFPTLEFLIQKDQEKKQKSEAFIQSQKGAMDKFITKPTPTSQENENEANVNNVDDSNVVDVNVDNIDVNDNLDANGDDNLDDSDYDNLDNNDNRTSIRVQASEYKHPTTDRFKSGALRNWGPERWPNTLWPTDRPVCMPPPAEILTGSSSDSDNSKVSAPCEPTTEHREKERGEESRSFENSYIPENPRTPKPLTFSKNRLRGAKNRSNISPVAKNFFRKNDFFFSKNFAYVQTFFLCICAHLYNTYLKRFVKKNLKKNAKKKVAHMHKK
ncbi:hypothetical protein LXL04_022464 [Taraxacum kok-saghyz]